MEAADDAFLRFLASLSGRTVDFLPGLGGFDDALTSLAFQELCRRHGITCAPFSDAGNAGDRVVVVGSIDVAVRRRAQLAGRSTVVLPGSVRRPEELDGALDPATTVFWCDRVSHRLAILQGAPPDRTVLCHHPAVHLDATALLPDSSAEREPDGALALDIDDPPACGPGDRVLALLDGRGDRWASSELCRRAVRTVAALMGDAAEVRTGSPGLAILAARLGKAVRLSPARHRANRAVFEDTIAPLYAAVALDLDAAEGCARGGDAGAAPDDVGDGGAEPVAPEDEVARLRQLLTAARREAQHLAADRDRLFVEAAELRDRRDAEAVAVVRSHREARERAERLSAVRVAEAETRAARERDAAIAAAAEQRSADKAAWDSAAREAAAREAAARDAAAREAAEREATLNRRLAAADAALDTRTHQALALQSAVDDHDARLFATEGRIARMRALIDARTASGEDARRDAEAVRRRLDELVSSGSWRLTRPFRKLSRGIRRLTGAAGARHG